MHTLAKWLLVAALMVSIGLHWAVLQSAAWVGMAVSYSMEKGMVTGITETFDGEHPCPLCKMVDAGLKSDQSTGSPDQAPLKIDQDLKFTLALVAVPHFVFQGYPRAEWPQESQTARLLSHRPNAPPPRQLA